MKRALVPGSYNPITLGHLDLILRAAELFDEVYAVIFDNCDKKYAYSLDERLEMLEKSVTPYSEKNGRGRIIACSSNGFLADYVKEHEINAVVKGARGTVDFDYEYSLSIINRSFDSSFETVILPSKAEYQHISSTVVRELVKYGKDVRGYVPEAIEDMLKK